MFKYLVVAAALTLAAPGLALADSHENNSEGSKLNPPKFPLVFNGSDDREGDRDREHRCHRRGEGDEGDRGESRDRERDRDRDCPASP
jgi:hypothetical protein